MSPLELAWLTLCEMCRGLGNILTLGGLMPIGGWIFMGIVIFIKLFVSAWKETDMINGVPKDQCGDGWKYPYHKDGTRKLPSERDWEHVYEFRAHIDKYDREHGLGRYAKNKDDE